MTKSNLPEVSNDFLKENKKIKSKTSKNGGPYSKHDKVARRNEVYRLHFDYGYSARKISELMNVNRNTINNDINFWYSRIVKKHTVIDPEYAVIVNLKRLENQRIRLREELDKTDSFQEKIVIERLILDIDSKILSTNHRLSESLKRLLETTTYRLNKWFEQNKLEDRCFNFFDTIIVSKKAYEKINKILKEDKGRADIQE